MPIMTYQKNPKLTKIDTKILNHKLLTLKELYTVIDTFKVQPHHDIMDAWELRGFHRRRKISRTRTLFIYNHDWLYKNDRQLWGLSYRRDKYEKNIAKISNLD